MTRNRSLFFAIYSKEIRNYFQSLTAYIFIVVFLTVSSWLFFQNFFLVDRASLRGWFDFLPWMFLLLTPALSMRIWAEEKRSGTAELLLTMPLPDWQIVLAKFLAGSSFLLLVLALSFPLPYTVSHLGALDMGPVIGGYIGSWLLGSAYLALGQWLSSLTNNQIVAFLLTIVSCFVLALIGFDFVLQRAGLLAPVFRSVSVITHFDSLGRGVIGLRDVVYFLSFIGFFLYLNIYTLLSRHWK